MWSDMVCPFCYMGEAALQQALESHGGEVEVHHHSYQLMPDLSPETAMTPTELLVAERGMGREQAEAANAQVSQRAAELGLDYRLEQAQATNTRTAHRMAHFAADHGLQQAMVRRLFAAYFTEGRHIGDPDTLADLAAEVGLDRDAAREVAVGDAYDDRVDQDAEQARRLGIGGVPFFVFDERLAVSGAQSVEVFQQALREAAGS